MGLSALLSRSAAGLARHDSFVSFGGESQSIPTSEADDRGAPRIAASASHEAHVYEDRTEGKLTDRALHGKLRRGLREPVDVGVLIGDVQTAREHVLIPPCA